MLAGMGEFLGIKKRIVAGLDLSMGSCQLSYAPTGDREPVTLSTVAEKEAYNIPQVMAMAPGEELWRWGDDALALLKENEAALGVRDLFRLAIKGEMIDAFGQIYASEALMALLIRRILALTGNPVEGGGVALMIITVRELNPEVMSALDRIVGFLHMPETDIRYMEYRESFFEYCTHQHPSLMKEDNLLLDHDGTDLYVSRLLLGRNTDRRTALVDSYLYPGLGEDELSLIEVLNSFLEAGDYACAYLIGDGFEGSWFGSFLRILCNGRRAFSGNNLYSKGACYAGLDRFRSRKNPMDIIYLGQEKLKADLGIKMAGKEGEEVFALLNAGDDWFRAGGEYHFLLSDQVITLVVSYPDRRPPREIDIMLGGLPQRRPKSSRIRLELNLSSENTVAIRIEDLGFGEIYPATHKVWNEEFQLELRGLDTQREG